MAELLIAVVGCYAALVVGLYGFQRDLLFLPDTSRPSLAGSGLDGFTEVTTTTADSLRLVAWYLPAVGQAPTVLYLHGNGGHIGYRAARAKRIAAAGFGVLLVEYRGYGGNLGAPSEEGLNADASAAISFLDARGVPRSQVLILGESMGTAVAVRLAAESAEAVGALILEAPFTSIADVAQHHYPLVPARWLIKDRFDTASRIALVRTPVLMFHGGRDTVIPQRFGRTLFEAAREPKQFVFIEDADHSTAFAAGFATFRDFVRRHVRPAQRGNEGKDTSGASRRRVIGSSIEMRRYSEAS